MPTTLDPNNVRGNRNRGLILTESLQDAEYNYDYPKGLDLKPGSKFHDFLRDEILARAEQSHRTMSKRHDEWRSIDRVLRAFVPADSDGEGAFPEIVMPQSYATHQTLMTYMSAAFLQDPIFRFTGVGPDDVFGAELMTQMIELQNQHYQNGLNLYTQWSDSFKYGIGAVTPTWDVERGYRTTLQDQGFASIVKQLFIRTGVERTQSELQTLFEGNKLINIDPYNLLPDPNVSAHEVQESEFFGWIDRTNIMKLKTREANEDDYIFNVDYLDHVQDRFTNITQPGEGRKKGKQKRVDAIDYNNPADIIWMYIDLIPSEWYPNENSRQSLGDSDVPEKWMFGLAADKVVIAAMPIGLDHNMIPATIAAPDFDGYSADPTSRLRIVHDIQGLMDFLYSSHIHNIKRFINNEWLVDPSLVNMNDVNDPKAGKVVRLRRRAWGKGGLDNAIKQLEVQDFTRGHVADTVYLANLMQETTGASDNLKGQLEDRTSRVSASEFRGIRSSSLSRLEVTARIISMQSMMPLAKLMASQTQQLMEEETYLEVFGESARLLQEKFNIERDRVLVSPLDLIVNLNLKSHDGTIPGSGDTETWFQIYQTLAQNPILQQQIDIVKVFEYLAEQSGAKNIEDFKIRQPQQEAPRARVEDEETIERELDAGNIRPVENGTA